MAVLSSITPAQLTATSSRPNVSTAFFHHAHGCRRVADVARVPRHFTGSILAFLGQLLQAFFAAGDRHDLRALTAEQLRRGAADPGGSAGHDADFTI